VTSNPEWEAWFTRVWADREENVYPRLFGSNPGQIFVLEPAMFLETFQQQTFDPRWLHYGVFQFPPTPARTSWLYVTSGMSNPWENDEPVRDGPSGFGCEFVFETTEHGNWAIVRLQQLMAFQILIAHGKYPGRELLSPYDRIPLRGPITPEPSQLQWLILGRPAGFDREFELESGWVELYQVFGATEEETAFARESGGDTLVERLTCEGAFPVTDPRRKSFV
jgi:hypothetical protein